MQMKWSKKLSSFILCVALTVAMALSMNGCGGKQENTSSGEEKEAKVQTEADVNAKESAESDGTVLGTGNTKFSLTVVEQEGAETEFEIHTDKETVGEALLDIGVIEGDEGEYGLYVKTVNGITADYDEDGTYWAFYINGEYADTGVDATPVENDGVYSFKVEKQV